MDAEDGSVDATPTIRRLMAAVDKLATSIADEQLSAQNVRDLSAGVRDLCAG